MKEYSENLLEKSNLKNKFNMENGKVNDDRIEKMLKYLELLYEKNSEMGGDCVWCAFRHRFDC